MKIICAGLPKTGTKTMKYALEILGFEVYDYAENALYLGKDWIKIFRYGGTTEDFSRMFQNVDAVTDVPGCGYWDEIHNAFPEAKIVFTMRGSEEEWFESLENQMDALPLMMPYLNYLSPTLKKMWDFSKELSAPIFGVTPRYSWLGRQQLNKLQMCQQYRRHNSHVLHNAPKDKLLVFNLKDGWGPLCEFLDVDIPDEPFPHKNKRGNLLKEMADVDPVLIRIRKEFQFSSSMLGLLSLCVAYKIFKMLNCYFTKN